MNNQHPETDAAVSCIINQCCDHIYSQMQRRDQCSEDMAGQDVLFEDSLSQVAAILPSSSEAILRLLETTLCVRALVTAMSLQLPSIQENIISRSRNWCLSVLDDSGSFGYAVISDALRMMTKCVLPSDAGIASRFLSYNSDIVVAAALELHIAAEPSSAYAILSNHIHNDSPIVRQSVADLAASSNCIEMTPLLYELKTDVDNSVRLAAVTAIEYFEDADT